MFLHAQKRGIAITGYAIPQCLETSVGLVTLETGIRVTANKGEWTVADREGDVVAETLQAGQPP